MKKKVISIIVAMAVSVSFAIPTYAVNEELSVVRVVQQPNTQVCWACCGVSLCHYYGMNQAALDSFILRVKSVVDYSLPGSYLDIQAGMGLYGILTESHNPDAPVRLTSSFIGETIAASDPLIVGGKAFNYNVSSDVFDHFFIISGYDDETDMMDPRVVIVDSISGIKRNYQFSYLNSFLPTETAPFVSTEVYVRVR